MTATELTPAATNAAPTPAPAANAAATAAASAPPPASEAPKVADAKVADSPLTAAAKAAEASLDYSGIKGEGMHADTLKAYVSALGEHKLAPKVGQALLDKVLAARDAQVQATAKKWSDELAADPDFAADKLPETIKSIGAALELADKDIAKRLKDEGFDSHPAIAKWALRVGRLIQKATTPDKHEPGQSAGAELSDIERYRASNPKTYAGFRELGINVN